MSGDISTTVGGNISIFEFAFSQVDLRIVFFAISDILMFDVAKVLLIQLDKLHLAGGICSVIPHRVQSKQFKAVTRLCGLQIEFANCPGRGKQTGSKRLPNGV